MEVPVLCIVQYILLELPRLTLHISQYIIPNITENAANTQTERNH